MQEEQFQVSVVNNATEYYTPVANRLYEQFLIQKPSVKAFGEDNIIHMLRDAECSLIKYITNFMNMQIDIEGLLNDLERYTRLYYHCDISTRSGIMTMIRCIIRDYTCGFTKEMSDKYMKASENIFNTVHQLISVTV